MAGVGDLFGGGDAIRQILLWSVVGQVVAPILAPVTQVIGNEVNTRASVVPISPAEAALGIVKGTVSQSDAEAEAQMSGINTTRFRWMTENTGEPISIEQALFLWRRGKIDQARLVHAIRQSRVRDEWTDAVIALGLVPISVSDAVDAAVENQIPRAEAERIAYENGVSAEDFTILYNTRGRPPGPVELLEMVRRGIIPRDGVGPGVLSLQQGISESAVKDKWIPVYNALLTYLPPPRTITALERQGVITPTEAQHLYQEAGLSPELAAAYSQSATHTKLTAQRQITEAQVLSMYQEQFISRPQAAGFLGDLHYTPQEVDTLLGWEDFRRELTLLKSALSRVQTLYVNRKIGTTSATHALNALGVSAEQQAHLFTTWNLERGLKVPTITAAQIATGVQHSVISSDDGIQALEELGYSPWDAWFYLSQHLHAAQPNEPPRDSITGQLP
jgi:hypothetical protein